MGKISYFDTTHYNWKNKAQNRSEEYQKHSNSHGNGLNCSRIKSILFVSPVMEMKQINKIGYNQ